MFRRSVSLALLGIATLLVASGVASAETDATTILHKLQLRIERSPSAHLVVDAI